MVGVSLGVAYATTFETPFGLVRRGQTVQLTGESFEVAKVIVDSVMHVSVSGKPTGEHPVSREVDVLVVEKHKYIETLGEESVAPGTGRVLHDGRLLVSKNITSHRAEGEQAVAGVVTVSANQPRDAPFDFDGDGKTDVAIFRPSSQAWWILPSGAPGSTRSLVFGAATDLSAVADCTGDGRRQGRRGSLLAGDGRMVHFAFRGWLHVQRAVWAEWRHSSAWTLRHGQQG